jgi:hypothetical protein
MEAKKQPFAHGREGGMNEARSRVAPGLEAVAGTLTHLMLQWQCNDVSVAHELGVAVGKLRRLEDLALDLSDDGRVYHALARGVAASGGDRPLPLVRRVLLSTYFSYSWANADLLASLLLLLPSVEVFVTDYTRDRTALLLLTACALRRAGYKHTWDLRGPREVKDAARALPHSAGLVTGVLPMCSGFRVNETSYPKRSGWGLC